jgi:hypothetical protein
MTDDTPQFDAEKRAAVDDQLIDSLLTSALQPDPSARESRIERVMLTVRKESIDLATATGGERQRGRSQRLARRWMPLTLAATLLLAAIWWLQTPDPAQQAYATVQRSLVAARLSICRLYQITATARRPAVGLRQVESQLYVDGEARFALRHPPLLLPGDLWLGSNGHEPWIVPPRGPVFVGGPGMLEQWIDEHREVTAPVLHVTTILERMAEHYDLEKLPAEAPPGAAATSAVQCDRVRGILRSDAPRLPQTVDLWADAETGVARYLILDWNVGPEAMGVQKVEVDLIDEPTVADDWFEHDGHHADRRPVLRMNLQNPVPAEAAADNSIREADGQTGR